MSQTPTPGYSSATASPIMVNQQSSETIASSSHGYRSDSTGMNTPYVSATTTDTCLGSCSTSATPSQQQHHHRAHTGGIHLDASEESTPSSQTTSNRASKTSRITNNNLSAQPLVKSSSSGSYVRNSSSPNNDLQPYLLPSLSAAQFTTAAHSETLVSLAQKHPLQITNIPVEYTDALDIQHRETFGMLPRYELDTWIDKGSYGVVIKAIDVIMKAKIERLSSDETIQSGGSARGVGGATASAAAAAAEVVDFHSPQPIINMVMTPQQPTTPVLNSRSRREDVEEEALALTLRAVTPPGGGGPNNDSNGTTAVPSTFVPHCVNDSESTFMSTVSTNPARGISGIFGDSMLGMAPPTPHSTTTTNTTASASFPNRPSSAFTTTAAFNPSPGGGVASATVVPMSVATVSSYSTQPSSLTAEAVAAHDKANTPNSPAGPVGSTTEPQPVSTESSLVRDTSNSVYENRSSPAPSPAPTLSTSYSKALYRAASSVYEESVASSRCTTAYNPATNGGSKRLLRSGSGASVATLSGGGLASSRPSLDAASMSRAMLRSRTDTDGGGLGSPTETSPSDTLRSRGMSHRDPSGFSFGGEYHNNPSQRLDSFTMDSGPSSTTHRQATGITTDSSSTRQHSDFFVANLEANDDNNNPNNSSSQNTLLSTSCSSPLTSLQQQQQQRTTATAESTKDTHRSFSSSSPTTTDSAAAQPPPAAISSPPRGTAPLLLSPPSTTATPATTVGDGADLLTPGSSIAVTCRLCESESGSHGAGGGSTRQTSDYTDVVSSEVPASVTSPRSLLVSERTASVRIGSSGAYDAVMSASSERHHHIGEERPVTQRSDSTVTTTTSRSEDDDDDASEGSLHRAEDLIAQRSATAFQAAKLQQQPSELIGAVSSSGGLSPQASAVRQETNAFVKQSINTNHSNEAGDKPTPAAVSLPPVVPSPEKSLSKGSSSSSTSSGGGGGGGGGGDESDNDNDDDDDEEYEEEEEEDPLRECYVAIKKVPRVFTQNVRMAKCTAREVAYMTTMDHPCVIKAHRVYIPIPPLPGGLTAEAINRFKNEYDDVYIVMPFCDRNLKNMLADEDVGITLPERRFLLFGVLCGVGYMHRCGVFHRDLKPANVLVNDDWSVKLCDFGQGKDFDMDVLALSISSLSSSAAGRTPPTNDEPAAFSKPATNPSVAPSNKPSSLPTSHTQRILHNLAGPTPSEPSPAGAAFFMGGGGSGGNNGAAAASAASGLSQAMYETLANTCTQHYASPETLPLDHNKGQQKANYNMINVHSVDAWSVGCIAAELLLRRPLFEGKQGGRSQLERIATIVGSECLPDNLRQYLPSHLRHWTSRTRRMERMTSTGKPILYELPKELYQDTAAGRIGSESITRKTIKSELQGTPVEYIVEEGLSTNLRLLLNSKFSEDDAGALAADMGAYRKAMDQEIDLIEGLLRKEPSTRITIDGALQHDYFASYTPDIVKQLPGGEDLAVHYPFEDDRCEQIHVLDEVDTNSIESIRAFLWDRFLQTNPESAEWIDRYYS